MTTEIENAMNTLRQAFKDAPDFAHGWHCNIAAMCYDAIRAREEPNRWAHKKAHEVSNDAARRFMKLAFDVETRNDLLKRKEER